jgi:hypothetical protein
MNNIFLKLRKFGLLITLYYYVRHIYLVLKVARRYELESR